jgi:hypothetical protein
MTRGPALLAMRSLMLTFPMVAALLTTGCAGTTQLLRSLLTDPPFVCINVTIYGNGAPCRVGPAVEVKAGGGAISVIAK